MSISLFVEPKINKLQLGRGVSLTDGYALEALRFHIPQSCVPEGTSVFLIMRQDSGARDVVELTRVGSQKLNYNYIIYAMSAIQPIKIHSGTIELSIMYLDKNNIATCTESLAVKLNITNYQFSHQIALLRKSNILVSEYYEKIVQLLKTLIEKGEIDYDSKDDSGTSSEVL